MLVKSGTITSASGSLGGLTASHASSGLYLRARTVPVNPNTVRQQIVRSALGALSQAWEQLTAAERAAWNAYGQQTLLRNALGDQFAASGQNHYLRSNVPRVQVSASTAGFDTPIALTILDDAPLINNTGEGITAITSLTLDDAELTLAGTIEAPASDDGHLLLYVGRLINAGKEYYRGPYQLAIINPVAEDATSFSSPAITTNPEEWLASQLPFVGARLPVRIRIAYDDGRLSQSHEQILTVAAPAV